MTNWIRWFDEVGMDDVAVGRRQECLARRDAPGADAARHPDARRICDHRGRLPGVPARAPISTRRSRDALAASRHQRHRHAAGGRRAASGPRSWPRALPAALVQAVADAYRRLEAQYGSNCDVAVRSSATAEDLPDASFAGQQETFLNIHGEAMLLDAVKRCYASLFTDRAIVYRVHHGFDHTQVALSVGVQKMVRSDLASAGVMFSIDTETGFSNAVLINGAYGLGESVVQGTVNPDEFYVFKPTLAQGLPADPPEEARHEGVQAGLRRGRHAADAQRPGVGRRPRTLRAVGRRHPDAGALGGAGRGALLAAARHADADGHRMGQGRPHRRAVSRAGAARKPSTRSETRWCSSASSSRRAASVLAKGRSVGEKIGQGPARVIRSVGRSGATAAGRGARHRDDRPRLGAGHEARGGGRHRSRRPHLPRRHRQPRAGHPGDRRHRQRARRRSRRAKR